MKTIVFVFLVLLLLPVAAQAYLGSGAINQAFNTSTRFEAMGSAGAGAPWGTDTNHWANPALLAYRPGLNYMSYRSELAKGLATDIVLTNKELSFGTGWLTFLLARGPVEGNYLDMGTQVGTDENGESTGEFESYMASESWGVGLDVVQILDRRLDHGDQPWSRYASVALGLTKTDFNDQLAPDYNLQDSAGAVTVKAAPVAKGSFCAPHPLRVEAPDGLGGNGVFGLTVGAAYGYSLLNHSDEFIVHVDADQSDPFPRMFVKGWSVHAALPLAQAFRDRQEGGLAQAIAGAIDPIISFTYSSQVIEPGLIWNPELNQYYVDHDTSGEYDEEGDGWELGLANILYIRRGHKTVAYGQIDDDTEGWGMNLQVGRMGGFRLDHAVVPQATGLPNVERDSWSVWVDFLAIKNR